MPTGNFDEPTVPSAPPSAPQTSFRLPADYYSAPPSDVKPFVPRWVPWGCGTAAAFFLVLLFAGGALLSGSRLNAMVDLVLGTTIGELKAMYASDVTAEQKKRFEAEVERMRNSLRQSAISVQDVQPFLQEMQKAIADQSVTAAEVKQLTEAARAAAAPAKQQDSTGRE